MASDLASEVAKLLQHGNPYIRKKAALCCVRIIRKVPDFAEGLLNPAATLLTDKHHGVLITAIKLCIVLCQASSTLLEQMKKQTSNLVQILKNLLISEYRAEYDVGGIIDPLLQIEILRLFRLIGKGDTDSSDIMSDILAQVITNTDSSKVPGSAILYECVQTIMHVEGTQGLRVLAINVLGRFLSNRDNNISFQAGEFVRNDALHTLIVIISNTPELHGYTVRLLYRMLERWSNQESLALVAIWCIGEYGEMLINHSGELATEDPVTITEPEVLDTLEGILDNFCANPNIKAFLLVSLLKLSSRYDSCREKIQALITKYKHCSIIELQQRAVEFDAVLTKHHNMRMTLVERIPVLNETVYKSKRADTAVAALGPAVRVASPPLLIDSHGVYLTACAKPANVDLVNLLDMSIEKKDPEPNFNVFQDLLDMDSKTTSEFSPTEGGPTNLLNIFSNSATQQDALVSSAVGAQTSFSNYKKTFSHSANLELSLNPTPGSSTVEHYSDKDVEEHSLAPLGNEQYGEIYSAQGPLFPSIVVLQTSRLKVLFDFTKPDHNPQITIIHATYLNSSCDLCTDLMLQAAVPKFLQLKLDPASGNVLLPNANGTITQCLTVTNTLHGQKPLMMRIRITYKVNGQEVIEQSQIENFPAGL